MSGFLLDSNVLLDLITRDPEWFAWSTSAFATAAQKGPVYINPVVYAEVSVGFDMIEEAEAVLPPDLLRAALPWDGAWDAGKAFLAYRRRGGEKRSPLPDFYVGAHARVAGLTLLTRDAKRYRTYFRDLPIIAPPRRRRAPSATGA
ncbi:type II toxin-antitoxin system VapC family toxin [Myxococcota bacterium]|nr:type II toxin-antitoxin system VapC family toxin [Myxococcota bacterium]